MFSFISWIGFFAFRSSATNLTSCILSTWLPSTSDILSHVAVILLLNLSVVFFCPSISVWTCFISVIMLFLNYISSSQHFSLSLKSFMMIFCISHLEASKYLCPAALGLKWSFVHFLREELNPFSEVFPIFYFLPWSFRSVGFLMAVKFYLSRFAGVFWYTCL